MKLFALIKRIIHIFHNHNKMINRHRQWGVPAKNIPVIEKIGKNPLVRRNRNPPMSRKKINRNI